MSPRNEPVNCGCGGEAVVHEHEYGEYEVYCPRCFITTDDYATEAEAIQAWNRAMGGNVQECAKDARCSERKWHINFDPYDESTSPKEKGYYRIIEEDGTEKTDFFFGEPRITGHGIGYWATSEKTIIAWARLEWK